MEFNKSVPILVVGGVCRHKGRVLVLKRKEGLSHAGLWELPGGKVESGETLQGALKREIKEELGIDAEVGSVVGIGHSQSEAGAIALVGLECVLEKAPTESTDHDEIRWIEHEDAAKLPIGMADLEILAHVLRPEAELSRISVGSVVRIFFVLYALMGLLLATFVMGFQALLPPEFAAIAKGGMVLFFVLPLVYGIIGIGIGFVGASSYNLLAKIVGGFRLRI